MIAVPLQLIPLKQKYYYNQFSILYVALEPRLFVLGRIDWLLHLDQLSILKRKRTL